jgi:L-alanine-DL-glutamate epimerase-like enolase superfamily enzyme
MLTLSAERQSWPIAGTFTISRGSKTAADVVTVTVTRGRAIGRGECVPYPRYGETVDGVLAELTSLAKAPPADLDRSRVPDLLKAHAGRNALDCALWDLEAKEAGAPVWQLAGLEEPKAALTAYTLSLGTPEEMAAAAARAAHRPLLKLKLGRPDDRARLEAVRRAAPQSRLVVDANEGWTGALLPAMLAACRDVGVELVEQPLPAADDGALEATERTVPVCADESANDLSSPQTLARLARRYDAVNIKLDKAGGLTPAIAIAREARRLGLEIMVGCMVGTSLAMAPAFLLAGYARWIDLDGPLLLARDRDPGIRYDGSLMHPPTRALWG